MAAITHVESMIDYALIRYGAHVKNSTNARADLLAWIQGAEEELWVAAPWSWREWEYTSFAFLEATSVYTLDTAIADVLDLYNGEGVEMRKVPPRIFQRYYSPTAATATGYPTKWTFDPVNAANQALTIRIWPVPGSGQTTCRLIAEKRRAVLVDADTSYSNFPEGRRMVVVLKGMKSLALHEGKVELQNLIQGDIDRFLAGLSAKDAEHFQGRL
jgi:hypothetical protein